MKYAWIVAWREFAENAKTKGFWIGICVFPLIIFMSVQVPILLEKQGTPTRHYLLVDQSEQFERVLQERLDKEDQSRLLQALNEYAAKYARGNSGAKAAADKNPRPATLDWLDEFSQNNPQARENFLKLGGKEAFLAKLQPDLALDAPKFTQPRRLFQAVKLPPELQTVTNIDALAQALKPYLRGAQKVVAKGQAVELYAAILIPADIENHIVRPVRPAAAVEAKPKAVPMKRLQSLAPAPAAATATAGPRGVQYWAGNLADTRLRDEVEQSVNSEIRRREYVSRGLDLKVIQQVEHTYVPVANLNPKKETGQEAVNMADVLRQWAPTGFVYLLWIAIFSIVQMLLNNTIEEKSNRIIEVLLSSVTPGELMMGKLAGIAAVGLTMVMAWLLTLVGILAWKSGSSSALAGPLFTILRTSNLVPAFLVYFVLGFLLYSGLILSIGSVCNTIKEAQNYMGVITIFLMVPLLTMMFIPKDPNGTLATVLSWIPIYTPFIMMNRVTADPPLRDIIGTMILLLATTLLVLWSAGKIFRIGILRTGQPPRLLEMLRWLRG